MAWIDFVKTIAQNVRNWLEKLKCQFTCCNSYVSVRVAGSIRRAGSGVHPP